IVVSLRHALQGKAGAGGIAFQLCEKEFGQLHISLSSDSACWHRQNRTRIPYQPFRTESVLDSWHNTRHVGDLSAPASAAFVISGAALLVRSRSQPSPESHRANPPPRCRSAAQPGISRAL